MQCRQSWSHRELLVTRPMGPMPSAQVLAELIPGVPPRVNATGISDRPVAPAILAWGLHDDLGWQAGISFVFNRFIGSPVRAVITLWVAGETVAALRGEDYERVPRIVLSGPPPGWPVLPGRYPKAAPEWEERAIQSAFADPTGEYLHLIDDIRRMRYDV